MIAANTRTRIRKRRGRHQVIERIAQTTLNAFLWQLITKNAESELGDAPDGTLATLTMPIEDLKGVPANFALTMQQDDEDTVTVTAALVKPKSPILLPDGSPADG